MPKQMPIKQVFSELERFGFVADSVWGNFTKQPQTQRINEVAEHTLKRLIGNKWLFGVGITGLTAAYLMRLAFWSQKHNSYEATRMLKQKPHSQEDEANSAKVQSKFSHKPFAPFASDVSLSGLPFGAQALMPPAANLPPVNMVLTGNSNLWGRPATPWYNAGTAAMPPASAMPNNVLLPNPGAQVWPA